MKIKKGDLVRITVGRDKGREAKVEKILVKDQAVLLPGLNQYKKHKKPQGEGRPGEILTLSRPVKAANVALICPKCKMPTRVGYSFVGQKKTRVCRKCDQPIS